MQYLSCSSKIQTAHKDPGQSPDCESQPNHSPTKSSNDSHQGLWRITNGHVAPHGEVATIDCVDQFIIHKCLQKYRIYVTFKTTRLYNYVLRFAN